jgi:hypothetical protein
MNIRKSLWTRVAHRERCTDELNRRVAALAVGVVFATIACTMIILFGSPQTPDTAFVQAYYVAQR